MGREKILLLIFFVFFALIAISYYISQKPFFLERHLQVYKSSANSAPKTFDYKIVLVGDSMTEILGNFDELQNYLKKYYPGKTFLILNYGYGSTSILSILERLEYETQHIGRAFQAVNDIDFNLIIIESFGHNPLSEYPLEEGLKRQTEALDKIVQSITQKHPRSSIVFMATLAPNSKRYAEGITNLLPEQRQKWADERSAYIKNHIQYARGHSIPLINIYEKSLDKTGDGNIDFIDTTDFIHPSPSGVFLISEETAKYIFTNNLLSH